MDITLLPSRRTLNIAPGETLLSALRRQGEPVSYSCEDGRCELCRCFLSFPDLITYPTPGDQGSGHASVLACQYQPNGNCLVNLHDGNDIVVIPAQIASVEVIAIETLADTVKRIRVRSNKPLKFLPGQHFEVTLGKDLVRLYSVSSPQTDLELSFDIQIHYYGRASQLINKILKPGTSLRLKGPLGGAYIREQSNAPILCVSNNTGLGPLLALIQTIADKGLANPVHIYVGFTFSEDVYGLSALKSAAGNLQRLKACQVAVGAGPLQRDVRRGLLTDVISADFGDLHEYHAYAFGSPVAIEAVTRLLHCRGVLPERLHAQPFHYSGD